MVTLLAHGGAGASWQALLVVIGVLSAVLFLLVLARVVKVKDANDLVLPLAGVVIISSLGTSASDTLSDQIGWALPVGVVALAGLVWFALRPDDFTFRSPPTMIVVGLAAVLGVALQRPLTQALHPPVVTFDINSLPLVDDARIEITSPTDGETVASPVTLTLELTGGTIGNTVLSESDAPDDPEQLGNVRLLDRNGIVLDVQPLEACTAQDPCTSLTYELDLEAGTNSIIAEFLTATGSTFKTSVFSRVTFEVS